VAAVVAGAVVLGGGVGFFVVGRSGGVSSASFIARADAICQPANAALSVDQASDYPGLAAGAAALATATEGQVTQLRGLATPGGSAGAQARTVVIDLDLVHQASRSLHDAAATSDHAATVAATNRLTTTSADATGAAGSFGMSACGSGLQQGIESLTLGSQSVLRASYVAQADTLCRAAAVEYADLERDVPAFATRDDLVGYLDRAIAMADNLAIELKAIPVPPGDEVTVAEMWMAADLVTAKNRAARAAATNGNPSGFLAAGEEIPVLGAALDVKLDAYGLLTCGSGFEDL
jgi:hypothetical protein